MEHQDWNTISIHNPQKKTVQKEIFAVLGSIQMITFRQFSVLEK